MLNPNHRPSWAPGLGGSNHCDCNLTYTTCLLLYLPFFPPYRVPLPKLVKGQSDKPIDLDRLVTATSGHRCCCRPHHHHHWVEFTEPVLTHGLDCFAKKVARKPQKVTKKPMKTIENCQKLLGNRIHWNLLNLLSNSSSWTRSNFKHRKMLNSSLDQHDKP